MSDDRPCNRCRKHKYGSCESWECKPELINLTNEQAIEHLTEYLDQAGMDVRLSPEDTAAIARGIEALKAQSEIVRCKDCKYRDVETSFCEGRGWPMQLVPNDGFCDKGERGEK